MTKKTIFVLAIIAALIIALLKWLTSDKEQKQETTEEVKEPASEKEENVKSTLTTPREYSHRPS